jgi:hypothetical protein
LPEAPAAGAAAASITVTAWPRRASACATEAPAMPAPITAMRLAAAPVALELPGRRPVSISRLPPKPGLRSTEKSALARRRRTSPVAVQVAKVAPGAARRRT